MKKTLGLLLAAMMALGGGASATEDEAFLAGDFQYAAQEGGLELVRYTGADAQVTVPCVAQGMTVAFIGPGAFAGKEQLETVALPTTARRIDAGAFQGCANLRQAVIPDSVTEIAADAFADCGPGLRLVGDEGSAAQMVAEQEKLNFETIDSLALKAYEQGDMQTGMAWANQYAAMKPKEPKAYALRAKLAFALGDLQLTLADASYALALDCEPEDAEALLQLRGSVLLSQERYAEAVRDQTRLIKHELQLQDSLQNRSYALIQLGLFDEAMADIDEGLKQFPDALGLYSNRAILHYLTGEYEKAVQDYEKVQEQYGSVPVLYYNIAESLHLLGDHEKAEEASQSGVALGGEASDAEGAAGRRQERLDLIAARNQEMQDTEPLSQKVDEAVIMINHTQQDEAVAVMNQAVKAHPTEADAYFYRAVVFQQLGLFAEAAADAACATSLGRSSSAYATYGASLIYLNRHEESRAALETAMKMNPEEASFRYNYAFSFFHETRYADALPQYDKAIELDGAVSLFYAGRGDANLNLQRYAEAVSDYQKTLELNPDDLAAKTCLEAAQAVLGQAE